MLRLAALLALLACTVVATAADSRNLVRNPSLEDAVAGIPEGWEAFQKPENAYQFKVAPGGRSGTKSMLIEGAGEYAGLGVARVRYDPAKQYAARGWVRVEGEAGTHAVVKLDYFTEDLQWLRSSYFEGQLTPGNKDWRLLSVISRPADAKDAKWIGAAIALGGKGRAWFDDVELVSRDAPPPSANLLRNGSMEDVVGAQPYGYALYSSEGNKAAVGWSDREPKDGWYSLQMTGNGDWAVGMEGRIPLEKGKTYDLTGYARAARGTAQIKFDYYKGNEHLGLTVSDDATQDTWKRLSVTSEAERFPGATHIAAAVVGLGDVDARFDGLVFTAK